MRTCAICKTVGLIRLSLEPEPEFSVCHSCMTKAGLAVMIKVPQADQQPGRADLDIGIRHDDGKPDWSLLPMHMLEGMIRVLEFGKRKYAAHNWRKGLAYSRITNSMQRHLNAFNAGEEIDPESGLSHADHILCNALFLKGMVTERPEMDDRFKKP